jgi:hypothetical protein
LCVVFVRRQIRALCPAGPIDDTCQS